MFSKDIIILEAVVHYLENLLNRLEIKFEEHQLKVVAEEGFD